MDTDGVFGFLLLLEGVISFDSLFRNSKIFFQDSFCIFYCFLNVKHIHCKSLLEVDEQKSTSEFALDW